MTPRFAEVRPGWGHRVVIALLDTALAVLAGCGVLFTLGLVVVLVLDELVHGVWSGYGLDTLSRVALAAVSLLAVALGVLVAGLAALERLLLARELDAASRRTPGVIAPLAQRGVLQTGPVGLARGACIAALTLSLVGGFVAVGTSTDIRDPEEQLRAVITSAVLAGALFVASVAALIALHRRGERAWSALSTRVRQRWGDAAVGAATTGERARRELLPRRPIPGVAERAVVRRNLGTLRTAGFSVLSLGVAAFMIGLLIGRWIDGSDQFSELVIGLGAAVIGVGALLVWVATPVEVVLGLLDARAFRRAAAEPRRASPPVPEMTGVLQLGSPLEQIAFHLTVLASEAALVSGVGLYAIAPGDPLAVHLGTLRTVWLASIAVIVAGLLLSLAGLSQGWRLRELIRTRFHPGDPTAEPQRKLRPTRR